MFPNILSLHLHWQSENVKKVTTPIKVKEEVFMLGAFKHLQVKLGSTYRKLEDPLPMPSELPQNYPNIVMVDLQQGRETEQQGEGKVCSQHLLSDFQV